MKSAPRVIVLKPQNSVKLIRQEADGRLIYRICDPGCALVDAFWVHVLEDIDDQTSVDGLLCTRELTIGAKGGLKLT